MTLRVKTVPPRHPHHRPPTSAHLRPSPPPPVQSVENDEEWITDIEHAAKGCKVDFPIIGDESREIALQLGMLNKAHKNAAGIPLPARGVSIIGPDKRLKLQLLYPGEVH